MTTTTLAGQILTERGFVSGRLRCTAAIQAIEPVVDAPKDRFVLPGFIDLHVHGGAGADVMAGADAVRQMARFHAMHGTTALLATTVTAPRRDLRAAFRGIGAAMAVADPAAARVLGAHLEGPFISPQALGAQPPFAIAPHLALVDELAALAPIRVATMAPEIDPDGALLRHFRALGARAQIGHTDCSYAAARAALAAGAAGFTHLFNAMSGLHHRRPGAVGAALAHGLWAELILDLVHVEEGAARTALRAIPNLYCITDAVAATGMPAGEYRLGQHRIFKQEHAVRLADGTLAGSVLTMDRALRNLVHLGVPLEEAARRCATLPAEHLGLAERGRLVAGAAADLVVVDRGGRLQGVLLEGRPVAITTD
jgi:N-acetylglucosamine-6-phosphate deacetylase